MCVEQNLLSVLNNKLAVPVLTKPCDIYKTNSHDNVKLVSPSMTELADTCVTCRVRLHVYTSCAQKAVNFHELSMPALIQH